MLSRVGMFRPWTAACALITRLPSAEGSSRSRVCVPLRAPFSKVKVGTTRCQAAAGGLLVGDILVAIGGQPVGDADDLLSALNSETVGKAVAVEVLRGGRPETVAITVGERK